MARGKKSGTQATATADPVTIQYNGNTISQFTDKGSVKLKCADKRMLSDVEINYGVENYAPSAVTSTGDVTITYGEETIGTLSDSGTLTLATGGTRVEHDIHVNYTKPESPTVINYVPLTIIDNTTPPSYGITPDDNVYLIKEDNGKLFNANDLADINAVIPYFNNDNYVILMDISPLSGTDDFVVTANNQSVSFDDGGNCYSIIIVSATYPESLTITISDKLKE